jgi:hypothetical protein
MCPTFGNRTEHVCRIPAISPDRIAQAWSHASTTMSSVTSVAVEPHEQLPPLCNGYRVTHVGICWQILGNFRTGDGANRDFDVWQGALCGRFDGLPSAAAQNEK